MRIVKKAKQTANLQEGDRVRVRHRVRVGQRAWQLAITGRVRCIAPVPTGIHTDRRADDDLWIDAVTLEKEDGELCRLTFDENTEVEVLERGGQADTDVRSH